MDEAEWSLVRARLSGSADDFALLSRLFRVDDAIGRWRESADTTAGSIAADALDQALGLLDELRTGELDAVLHATRAALTELPSGAD